MKRPKSFYDFVILLVRTVQFLIKLLIIVLNWVFVTVFYFGSSVVLYLIKVNNVVEMKRKNNLQDGYISKQQKIKRPNEQTPAKYKTGCNKDVNNFVHKNPSGDNNWMKFLESSQQVKKQFTKNVNRNQNVNEKQRRKEIEKLKVYKEKNNAIEDIHVEHFKKPEGNKDVKNDKSLNSKITLTSCNIREYDKVLREPRLTKQIAMDCEMVGVEMGVDKNMLARVSLVNANGDCIYDKYVKPTEPVLDYRTKVSGIRPRDLENATDFKTVQEEVADIIRGRILVGHALKNDLKVLYLSHPKHAIRDTSKYNKFREGRTPALRKLVKKYLGATIQDGEHNSIQDALAAMQLYKMFKKEWEASIRKPIRFNIKDNKKCSANTNVLESVE